MSKENNFPDVGKAAPAFTLESSKGGKVRLSSLKGQPVVVYFYPKDNTPGCTVEAQEFQAALGAFRKAGAAVLGISPDSVESHCKFADKQGLHFPLLVDTDHVVCEKYGVWVEKNMYGRKFWGVQRATLLINSSGKVAQVWPKVKPKGHAAQVLEAVKAL
ncbi:MAG: thioredoxin-dependent thiol peroxidase [Candidatus Hydrogenedentota bacterium]|nr:MAG: thioredoxin-dependent thiol peroxidase [Candidatus Hydrogenedentota bacterium]